MLKLVLISLIAAVLAEFLHSWWKKRKVTEAQAKLKEVEIQEDEVNALIELDKAEKRVDDKLTQHFKPAQETQTHED